MYSPAVNLLFPPFHMLIIEKWLLFVISCSLVWPLLDPLEVDLCKRAQCAAILKMSEQNRTQ